MQKVRDIIFRDIIFQGIISQDIRTVLTDSLNMSFPRAVCVHKVSLGILVNHWEISIIVMPFLWKMSAAPWFWNMTPSKKIENVNWKE